MPAATLLVETTLDTTTVTIGPARRTVRWRGWVLIASSIAGGWAIGPVVGPILASTLSLGGAILGGGLRIWDWVRHEAPLELEAGRHGVIVRRVFQGRVLHERSLSLAVLHRVRATGKGLVLELDDERIELAAGFRTAAELQTVAEWLQDRAVAEGGVEGSDALDALRGRAREDQGL